MKARYWWWTWTHGRWHFRLDLSAIHRPQFTWVWGTDRNLSIGLAWGNGNSDPVWGAEVAVKVPERLAVWLPQGDHV